MVKTLDCRTGQTCDGHSPKVGTTTGDEREMDIKAPFEGVTIEARDNNSVIVKRPASGTEKIVRLSQLTKRAYYVMKTAGSAKEPAEAEKLIEEGEAINLSSHIAALQELCRAGVQKIPENLKLIHAGLGEFCGNIYELSARIPYTDWKKVVDLFFYVRGDESDDEEFFDETPRRGWYTSRPDAVETALEIAEENRVEVRRAAAKVDRETREAEITAEREAIAAAYPDLELMDWSWDDYRFSLGDMLMETAHFRVVEYYAEPGSMTEEHTSKKAVKAFLKEKDGSQRVGIVIKER